MFGIANQMLAVIALAIVSAYLANEGRARYLWVTGVPMLVVMTTTGTAGADARRPDGRHPLAVVQPLRARRRAMRWPTTSCWPA